MPRIIHITEINLLGLDREVEVTFWANEITEGVAELEYLKMTEEGRDITVLLSDDEINAKIVEQIEKELDEDRRQAKADRDIEQFEEWY